MLQLLTYHLAAVHPSCSSSPGREKEKNSALDTTDLENSPFRYRPTFQNTTLNGKDLHAYVGRGIKVGSIRITKKDCVYAG